VHCAASASPTQCQALFDSTQCQALFDSTQCQALFDSIHVDLDSWQITKNVKPLSKLI
jgi:hypothetical protein